MSNKENQQQIFQQSSNQNSGFFEKVYSVVQKIPLGSVATYGQIAKICGNAKMSRQVGWALHVNPRPHEIPCHRVVNRHGGLSSAFAFGGANTQAALLAEEGVKAVDGKVNLEVFQCNLAEIC